MTIEEAIKAYLETLSAVTALTTKIRPDELILGDVRADGSCAIVISVDKDKSVSTLDGMVDAMVIVSSVSKQKSVARALDEAIRVNGTNPGTGLDNSKVTGVGLDFHADMDDVEAGYYTAADGSPTGLHQCAAQYRICYYEVR